MLDIISCAPKEFHISMLFLMICQWKVDQTSQGFPCFSIFWDDLGSHSCRNDASRSSILIFGPIIVWAFCLCSQHWHNNVVIDILPARKIMACCWFSGSTLGHFLALEMCLIWLLLWLTMMAEQWLHLSSYQLVLSSRFLEIVKFSVTTAGNVLPPDILKKMKISHLLHIVYHAEVFHMTFMFCQVLPDPFWQLPGNCQFLAELGSAAEFCPQH